MTLKKCMKEIDLYNLKCPTIRTDFWDWPFPKSERYSLEKRKHLENKSEVEEIYRK